MTITAFDIWFIGLLDHLNFVLCLSSFLLFAAAVFITCAHVFEESFSCRQAVISIAVAVTVALAWVATPSTKTAAAMIVLPAIVNSQSVQELPGEIIDAAKTWLKSFTKGEGNK